MQRLKLSLACLLCLTWVCSARAQTALESDAGVVPLQDFSGGVTLSGTYFDIRHLSGNGVGYLGGYTQIGAFQPFWVTDNTMIGPNGRMFVTNNNQIGGSLGGVLRHYVESQDRIYGVNAYGDFDRTVENFNYQQFGLGFESLGQWIDVRSNLYLPTSTDQNFVRAVSLGNTPFFQGNGINFIGVGQFQQSMRGADFEVGAPLTGRTPWLRGYVGSYVYDGDGSSPVGVKARIDAAVSDDFTIGVQVTEDKTFGTNVNAMVDFRFSGWRPTRYFPNWSTRERMLTSVQRNWRVATSNFNQNVPIQAVNPGTGLPYFAVWVDNSNPLPGNGTFENPFHDFQPSQPYPGADLILVRRGVSDVVPLNGPVQLFDNQRLLGEGREHQFAATATFGPFVTSGVFNLPGFTNTGLFPTITAPGDIVTLANNNEVSAFNLINAGGNAITNTAAGSNNFALNYLNVNNNAGGIILQNTSGRGFIQNVNALDNAAGGISVTTDTNLNLLVQNVTSNGSALGNQAFGLELVAHNAVLDANLQNVQANNNVTGLILTSDPSTVNLNLSNVNLDNNILGGFAGTSDGGALNLTTTTFSASNNTLDNVNIAMINGTAFNLIFNDASVTGSTFGNGIIISDTAGTGNILFGNVDASANNLDGVSLTAAGGSQTKVNFGGPFVANNNLVDGIFLNSTGASDLNVAGSNITATNSNRHGLNFNADTGSNLVMQFNTGALDFSGQDAALQGSAIFGTADNSTVTGIFNGVTGTTSGASGMNLAATNNAQVNITVTNGNFQNSGVNTPNSAAINVNANTGADVVLNVTGTPLNNNPAPPAPSANQTDGFRARADNGSSVTATLVGSDLSNNQGNAIDLNSLNGSAISLGLNGSNGNNSGGDGILLRATGAGRIDLAADNSTFNLSGQNGINATANSDGDIGLNFVNGSNVTQSFLNGLLINTNGAGSTVIGTFSNGSFSDSGRGLVGINTQDAIQVNASGSALVDLTLNRTFTANILGTQQRGLAANLSGGADLNFTNISGLSTNNLRNAVLLGMDGAGTTANLNITNTPMTGSGRNGFEFFTTNGASLNATLTSSSLDNSGSIATANGIQGLSVTGSIANLNLLNSSVTGVSGDAVNLRANGAGTIINATFDNSPLDNAGLLTSGNALDLNYSAGAVGTVTLQNNSTAVNSGGDGFLIFATGAGTNLTVNAFTSAIVDSGQTAPAEGINATVSNSAQTTLNIFNTPVTNTGVQTPQLDGLLFNVLTAGDLRANFLNSNLSNHTLNGITGTVASNGNVVINLDNTPVDNNGLFGVLANANTGGDLQLNAVNGTSFSNNGASGVRVAVDGSGSSFISFMDTVNIDGNGGVIGGDGMNIDATNDATVNVALLNASLSNNANNGLLLTFDGGSDGIIGLSPATIDNNGEEGIHAEVTSASTLLLNMQGGSVANNGIGGTFDNVRVNVTTGSNAETVFRSVNADSSTLNGFSFTTNTGSTLLAQLLNGVSASNNANGSGVRFIASDANTQGVLFMNGSNTFDNNGTAVVGTLLNPQAGAGVFFDAAGAARAGLRFTGSASNNGNAANLFADVDGDGDQDDDGVYARMNFVGLGAVEFVGPGNVSNNQGDGIDFNANATPLGTIVQPSVLTPPSVTVGSAGNAIVVDGLGINANGGGGLSLIVSNTNMSGGILFTNSQISGNTASDGVLIRLTNITGLPNIGITNSTIEANGLNGVNLDLNNAPINQLLIQGNNAGNAAPGGTYGFTLNQAITNLQGSINNTSSNAAIFLNRITFDLSTTGLTPTQLSFASDPNIRFFSQPFRPTFGAVGVGLNSVNGTLVNPATSPLQDTMGNVLVDGGIPEGGQLMDLTFNDFTNADFGGLQYFDNISDIPDGQFAEGFPANVALLQGATVTGFFTGGRTVTAIMDANGNAVGSQAFPALFGGISGNLAGDGIHISQVNSSITDVLIDDNQIQANRGNGINFANVSNSGLGAGPDTLTVSNNNIVGNTSGAGFRLINPTTPNTPIFAEFIGNTINQNTAGGIDIQLVNGNQSLVTLIDGNTINQNTGGDGVNIQVGDNRNISGLFNNNTINQNSGRGVDLVSAVNSNVSVDFTGNTINGNTNEGINVQLQLAGQFNSLNFYGNTIGTAASRNGGPGVRLEVADQGQFNWNLGNSAQAANNITGNTDAGVALAMSGTSLGRLAIENSNFSNTINGTDPNFNGGGLEMRLQDFAQIISPLRIGDNTLNNTSFTNNASSGIRLRTVDNSIVSSLFMQNLTVTGNALHGVEVERRGNSLDNVTLQNSTITGTATSGDGVNLLYTNGAAPTPLLVNLTNNVITANTDGVDINTSANSNIVVDIIGNTISNNRDNGILISSTNASSVGNPLDGTASRLLGNTINNNGNVDGEAGIRLIANSTAFHNFLIGNNGATRTTLTSNFDGIRISDSSTAAGVNPTANTYNITQTDIIDTVNDGIQLDLTNGNQTTVNIGSATAAPIASRDDVVITRTTPAPGGSGSGINIASNGRNNIVNIRNSQVNFAGVHGIVVDQTGGDMAFNLQSSNITFSGQRGVFVTVQGGSGGTAGHGNNYNIGGTNLAGGAGTGEGVLIQNNGQQGLFFLTESPASQSARIDLGTPNYGGGAQIDVASATLVRSRMNVVGTSILSNGTVGNVNSDGAVFAIGTNTRQDVLIAGSTINGNVLDDVRIFPFVSVEPPTDSTNNAPPGPPNDFLRLDPVARMGLVFGSIQAAYDSNVAGGTTLFPSQIPSAINLATRNTGEQVNPTTAGTAAVNGMLVGNTGQFTTGDVFRTAGRSSTLLGTVQQTPLSNTGSLVDNLNQFIQLGIEQDLDATFNAAGFTLSGAALFP